MRRVLDFGRTVRVNDTQNPIAKTRYANKRTSPYQFDKNDVKVKPRIWFEDLPRPLKPPGVK